MDLEAARELCVFIDNSPSPYHAVATVRRVLEKLDYKAFAEKDKWKSPAGTKGFVQRAGGTLIAWKSGKKPPSEAGFRMIAAHTDSPNLRLKPVPDVYAQGYHQWGVEIYGGVLLSTWMDRDLAIAGRVVMADGSTNLIRTKASVARVPNVAIHLNRGVNKEGLVLNPQRHLLPVIGMAEKEGVRGLKELMAEELKAQNITAKHDDILAWDLSLFENNASDIGGSHNEYIFAPRLDNLANCYHGMHALTHSADDLDATPVLVLYDHEEVGSRSDHGAQSRLLLSVLERLSQQKSGDPHATSRAISQSLLVSADMAHAVHPNYATKHDRNHMPRFGDGPTIKTNVNQSYATDAVTGAFFARLCKQANSPVQHFVSRNDQPCGGTVGPMSAAKMAVRAVDVGNPMLSMHSAREMAAVADVAPMNRVMTEFYKSKEVPGAED